MHIIITPGIAGKQYMVHTAYEKADGILVQGRFIADKLELDDALTIAPSIRASEGERERAAVSVGGFVQSLGITFEPTRVFKK